MVWKKPFRNAIKNKKNKSKSNSRMLTKNHNRESKIRNSITTNFCLNTFSHSTLKSEPIKFTPQKPFAF